MTSAKAVAAYLVRKFNSLGDGNEEFSGNNDLTNLKLQKLLYFAQVEYMQSHDGEPLFDDDIEAWQYGPVVREVYNAFAQCGAYFITDFDIDYSEFGEIDSERAKFLDDFLKKGTAYSAWSLVNKTHEKNSAWDKTYAGGTGDKTIIPKELLMVTAAL